jgi:signal peptidase I
VDGTTDGHPALTRTEARQRRRLPPVLLAGGLLLLLLVVRAVAAEPFSVPTDSMAPTLLPGDHVLVDKLAYRFGDPRRGELVVFHSPANGEILLKRVVALAGDQVSLEDGVLHVNGRGRTEPYVDLAMIDTAYFGPVRVPRGGVFVMGDRRHDSIDSRRFGAVPRARIVGRVRLRIWPPGRLGSP